MLKEYSRILKFDFPSIPILGSLLLLLIWLNDSRLIWFLLDKEGKPVVAVLTATVVILGAAGLFLSQLISFALFDQFFEIRHKILKSPRAVFNDTSEEWFTQVLSQLSLKSRKGNRDGDHCENRRRNIEDLSQGQKHAAIHALEVSLREKHPEIGSQIEHFYSMYVIFSILGLVSLIFSIIGMCNSVSELLGSDDIFDINIHTNIVVVDIIFSLFCFISAVHARRFKEHLRIKIFNASRMDAIKLLSKWYQRELPKKE